MKQTMIYTLCFVIFGASTIFISSCDDDDNDIDPIVVDIDGNEYSTITVGSQVWMAENLRVTRCNDGTDIALITNDKEWDDKQSPGFCWYSNNEEAFAEKFGALYNGYVLESCEVCPDGWHIPTADDWTALADHLGGFDVAGAKLKQVGTDNWPAPNANATDEVGFNALPAGYRWANNGKFFSMGEGTGWWGPVQSGTTARAYYIVHDSDTLYHPENHHFQNGQSIRCIKD